MDVRKIVGANVRRLRLEANLSQEAVAERMGVDRAYVSGLELGTRNPTIISLWQTAEALGVELIELLKNSETGLVKGQKSKRSKRRVQR